MRKERCSKVFQAAVVGCCTIWVEDVLRLDKAVYERIIKKIEWLAAHFDAIVPQPLKGKFHGIYKLTIGDWRVPYTFDMKDKTITIQMVGHRSEIYKS